MDQLKLPPPSDRLYFRPFQASDAADFYALNNDPDVLRFTGDDRFNSLDEAKLFLENYPEYERHGFGRWMLRLNDTDECIGWCGLKFNEEEEVDVGFRLFRKYWNKGYATEAVIACVQFGLNELMLPYIVGRAMPQNKASLRVMEKAGMSYWKSKEVPGMHEAVYYKIES